MKQQMKKIQINQKKLTNLLRDSTQKQCKIVSVYDKKQTATD